MPRYYCDYCDAHLTHDSPSVRKQHNSGYKHKANVRNYYMQFEEQTTQSLLARHVQEKATLQQQSDSYMAYHSKVNETFKKQIEQYTAGL